MKWQLVDDRKVRVTDKYYDEALQIEVRNLLKLDTDRLLAGFRETAGIIAGMKEDELERFMKGKKRYGGSWENGLIGGHTLGHYITALAQAVANPGLLQNSEEKRGVIERLNYIINALDECQKLTEGTVHEGFIFGAELPTKEFRDNPELQFDNVERGACEIFTQAWVPWYTMHKIITGLNAAAFLTDNRTALKVANGIAEWIAGRQEKWTDEVQRTVLSIEYGGMNDCLYELHRINLNMNERTNSMIYDAARKFDEDALFKKALEGEKNFLNHVHANTTIPKFIGALAGYEADEKRTEYLEYAKAFFDVVTDRHTYVTGGNSDDEHFGEDYVLDAKRSNVNNETCNTYNMLKLARRLFAATGEKKYLDYAERTLINAIMASQNHDTGFTTYFQPMATGYHKVFNTLDGNFWCCTGTGYENFTKLQRGIYYKSNEKLLVAAYISSKLKTETYSLIQECDFTKSGEVKIRIIPEGISEKSSAKVKEIWLRIPDWACDINETSVSIYMDGNEQCYSTTGGFAVIPVNLSKGKCEIKMELPLKLSYSTLPDSPSTVAFMYGPYVLSARLGTAKISTTSHGVAVCVSNTKSVDADELKITEGETALEFLDNLDRHLIKQPGTMEFTLNGTDKELTFTTHYNQYTESYGIYWKLI